MITIHPHSKTAFSQCPNCEVAAQRQRFIWQGIHNSEKIYCKQCGDTYIVDLPIGHSLDYSVAINRTKNTATTSREGAESWFTDPYVKALNSPNKQKIAIKTITNQRVNKPLILNCLDYLYGHSFLKLLNAERHLEQHNEFDLVVIIPKFLQWMVPDGVAKVFIVDMGLSEARNFYLSLHNQLAEYIEQFETVHLSKAFAHPKVTDISRFTGQESYQPIELPRVTYIWRNDRPWFNNIYIVYLLKKLKIIDVLNLWQYIKVLLLFIILRRKFPKFEYTVAGFGKKFAFPTWINDERVDKYTAEVERWLCKIYAESKLVVGVHGSNMLLPTAHADMCIDLLPSDRLGNFAQDVIYERKRFEDLRLTAFKYRYESLTSSVFTIAKVAISMLKYSGEATKMFTFKQNDK